MFAELLGATWRKKEHKTETFPTMHSSFSWKKLYFKRKCMGTVKKASVSLPSSCRLEGNFSCISSILHIHTRMVLCNWIN